jgi:hypothetical protein
MRKLGKCDSEEKTKGPRGSRGLFGGRIMLLPILRERYWQKIFESFVKFLCNNCIQQKNIKKNSTMQYFFLKKMRFVEKLKKGRKYR